MQIDEDCWVLMRAYKDAMGILPASITAPVASGLRLFKEMEPRWYVLCMPMRGDLTPLKKIGNLPFSQSEDEWPPPCFWPATSSVPNRVQHRGNICYATDEDVRGMNECLRRDPAGLKSFLLERLAGGELAPESSCDDSDSHASPLEGPNIEIESENESRSRTASLERAAEARFSRAFEDARTLDDLLAALASALQIIFDEHGEITDTEIRERMCDVIDHGFIHQTSGYGPPHGYATDSYEADAAVRAVLGHFVAAARPLAEREGIQSPDQRHAAFYRRPELELDEFFGWSETPSIPSTPYRGTSILD
jgi:hypothetical protein